MDYLSTITSPIKAELQQFNEFFEASLTSSNDLLNEVLAHLHRSAGKKMRPILVLLTAKALGEVNEATLHAAVSLELLHTASLVHDDVVDESDERRGQPSVNVAFTNKVAVLSGDYLLATSLYEVSQTRRHEIVDLVARLGQNLADGELLQLSNTASSDFSEQVYFDIIKKKTALLFESCTEAGALSVGASAEIIQRAKKFGEIIGLCFQIKDDIFDYTSSQAEIGKPTGNDMCEGKLTLPVLYALNQNADEKAHSLALKVKNGTITEEEIAELVAFTIENGGISYAEQVMDAYREEGRGLLSDVPDLPVKQSLLSYLDFVIDRKK